MTSRTKRIVSRLVKVDFPSNFKKDFIRGERTSGMVWGKDWVI